MSDSLVIILTAGLVATACGLLGPLLVARRVALMGDAVSHAVLPGIVVAYLLLDTRAPLAMIAGATIFAVLCVMTVEWLAATGLLRSDAAIGLVFPTLFALGVLGVHRYAENVHLDLDATIYGEITFAPLRLMELAGTMVPRSLVIGVAVVTFNLMLLAIFWKELKLTSFDPRFASVTGFAPRTMSRLVLIAVAITAVTAFESVGAILVVALLIVPAATAYLLSDRLWIVVALSVGIGWVCAIAGQTVAAALDANIAGSMGVIATALFAVALLVAPRHGAMARLRSRRRATA